MRALGIVASARVGSTFAPDDLSGLTLWLDATDSSTLTLSGSSVTGWADKSPTGASFGIRGGLTGVTSGTRTIGGLNAIDFNGSGALTSSASFTLASATAWSLFVVVELDISASAAIVDQDESASRVAQFLRTDASSVAGAVKVTDGTVTEAGPTASTGTPYIARSTRASSVMDVRLNGTGNGTTASPGTMTLLSGLVSIGNRRAATLLNGAVGEVICYSTDIGTDVSTVESYLAAKWGITL